VGYVAKGRGGILNRPIHGGGRITDWTQMERVWHHMYSELQVSPDAHPAILTQPLNEVEYSKQNTSNSLYDISNRKKMMEVFFETFDVPAFYISSQAILAAYGAGRSQGIIVDSGHEETRIAWVWQGACLGYAAITTPLSGTTVTNSLAKLLKGHSLPSHPEMAADVLADIKERLCEVSMDKDVQGGGDEKSYQLPDGRTIKIGRERFLAAETLFDPSLSDSPQAKSLQVAINDCVQKTDDDLRRRLYGQIILVSTFPWKVLCPRNVVID